MKPKDHDPDRDLAEELVARLRREPEAFRNVQDLVRRSGVGSSKLDPLFRLHYHATPLEMLGRARIERARRALLETERPVAEIGFDVGYETLSAFNDNFRARSGMSPRRYRRLLGAERFVLELPSWYPIRRVLAYLGRDPASPTQRVDGNVFHFALGVHGASSSAIATASGGATVTGGATATATAAVAFAPLRAACDVTPVSGSPAEGWAPEVHGRLVRLLGLAVDPRPFERRRRGSPDLRRLIEGQRGLTIPQTHDLADGFIWVVVGQQVSLAAAFNMRRRLADRFGRRVGAFALQPPLAALAELDYGDLQGVGFSRRKAEYLVDLARLAADGAFDVGALERSSATAVERRLLAVRGFGPWSVHYLMMRALALADCVPVGDVALAKSLASFFGLEARPDKRRVLELMKPFAPHRSLATFHLWNRLGNTQ